MALFKFETRSTDGQGAYLRMPNTRTAATWSRVVRVLKPNPVYHTRHCLELEGVSGVHLCYCVATPREALAGDQLTSYELSEIGLAACRSILVMGQPLHDIDAGGLKQAAFALWDFESARTFILSCKVSSTLYRGLAELERIEGPLTDYNIRLGTDSGTGKFFRYRVERTTHGDPIRKDEVYASWKEHCQKQYDPSCSREEVADRIDQWLTSQGLRDHVKLL